MRESVQMALQKSHSISLILPLVIPCGNVLASFFTQLKAVDPGYKKLSQLAKLKTYSCACVVLRVTKVT